VSRHPSDFTVRNKRVVVVGGARSGVSAARLLAARGARVALTDTRDAIDGQEALAALGVELVLGGHPPGLLTGADLVVLSPGVPLTQPMVAQARKAGVPVIGEVEMASRWLRGRVVAITGTKGKSTTTALTGRILEEAGLHAPVGGNIGIPLADHVESSTPDTIHVVEVSSFQLESTDTFHPWIAALLNLTPDHLDRHAHVDEYATAKARIFARQTAEDWAVANADDEQAIAMARRGLAPVVRFARVGRIDAGVTIRDGYVIERTSDGDAPILPIAQVRLIGPHLLEDVLAAAAITRLAGVAAPVIARAVAGFRGLEHAMEWVAEIGGVRFVNDSKATNLDAARQAIETFGPGVVVIMGGRFKGGDWRVLREPLESRNATVVAIGEAAPIVEEALAGAVAVTRAATMADAVKAAFAVARPGSSVVLAPACSSFDMFVDYAARGRAFKDAVQKLGIRDSGFGIRDQD
jgi:UDP-N-acetylmuramoylalanine--D-glutamate ligase